MSEPTDRPAEGMRDPWARPPEVPEAPGAPGYEQPNYPEPGAPPASSPPQGGSSQYGQPEYGPPQYGPPAYPGSYASAAPQTSSKATTVLVLGIAGLVLLPAGGIGIIAAVVSLVLSGGAKREIERSGGRLVGLGMVTAARITSWLAVAVSVFFVVVVAVAVLNRNTGSGGTYGGY